MLAVKNLARRKIRSTLTVLGVAIGIASVVALVAVARGLRKQFNELFDVG
ncbi:MAG: ABC transporter permease, partial [Planctomycetota bacterium]